MSSKLLLAGAILLVVLPAACTGRSRVDSTTVAVENRDMRAVLVFSDSDRTKIRHYYTGGRKTGSLPPGLAKKKDLPPGLEKHIEKYGELPPGLRGNRLPPELDRTLSRLPDGYVRLKVGTDVVLMNEKTRMIFDVVWDVN